MKIFNSIAKPSTRAARFTMVAGLSDDQSEFLKLQAIRKEREFTKEEANRYVQLAAKLRAQGVSATIDDSAFVHPDDASKSTSDKGGVNFGEKAGAKVDASKGLDSTVADAGKAFGAGAAAVISDLPMTVKVLLGVGVVIGGIAVLKSPVMNLTRKVRRITRRRR